ncbi:acyltransferase [Rhodococcus fascians]|nr:acyltransferase [Rhodococcus fascians]MBY4235567.1 acyltransferase [Rhodococcus fascians]MBY4251258.1 acyltransferase [Rhodococcus fascians]MBY4266913.1 acyltransferase [Rhodococcus fascians]
MGRAIKRQYEYNARRLAESRRTPVNNRSRLPKAARTAVRRILNKLSVYGNVQTGPGFSAGRGSIVSSPHGLTIGKCVSIGPKTIVQVDGTIGDYTMIGMGVQIVGREDHALDEIGVPMLNSTWVGDRRPTERDRISIGTDVWIGAGAIILSGVTIGSGSVVGAGALVTKDLPEFSICGGSPARVLGQRFKDDSERARHLKMIARL